MSDKHLFKFYCGDSNDKWFDHESRLDSMEDAVKEGMSMFDKRVHSDVDDDGDDMTVTLSVHCTALRDVGLPVCDCTGECPEDCEGSETYIKIVDETALDDWWAKNHVKVEEDAQ